ncbi:hypothetical protein BGZ57DRAFT_852087 [Hyaloscypha finlandica]|nr:hypothetical protein BGZ57DRAFT_852087 [Hyaloscypha finlandica]
MSGCSCPNTLVIVSLTCTPNSSASFQRPWCWYPSLAGPNLQPPSSVPGAVHLHLYTYIPTVTTISKMSSYPAPDCATLLSSKSSQYTSASTSYHSSNSKANQYK